MEMRTDPRLVGLLIDIWKHSPTDECLDPEETINFLGIWCTESCDEDEVRVVGDVRYQYPSVTTSVRTLK